MEKFLDIVCRAGGLSPSAVVLVATAKALKHHGGDPDGGLDAIERGADEPAAHISRSCARSGCARSSRSTGSRATPTRRSSSSGGSALEHGAHAAELNDGFERGGEGAAALAEAVVDAAEQPERRSSSPIRSTLRSRRRSRRSPRASTAPTASIFLQTAKDKLKQFAAGGLGRLPICMAKTHLSLSHDPALANAPTGFTLTVRDVRAYTGAGWLVALCGDDADDARAGRDIRRRSTSTSTRTAARLGSSSFLDAGLKEFLDAVPARTPAPGGGAVAAIAASLAAGLTAMAARFAPDEWERRAEVVGRAEELRARVEPLADADAEAYGAFMAERTDENVERIIAIPFELAEVAAEVAELAALVAAEGNPNVTGDAAAGADLAAAAASVGARLVRINARRATSAIARAAALAERAAARRRTAALERLARSRSRRAVRRRASTRASRAGGGRS